MQVEEIEIDEHVLDKIEIKHGVKFQEVEEACFSPRRHVRHGRLGLYKLFSRSDAGRLLVVIFVDRGEGLGKLSLHGTWMTESAVTTSGKSGVDMTELDREIQRLEEGNAWEDTDEVVDVEFKKPLNVVVPVRLSADTWGALRREAKQVGVGPSTLARMWLMERLTEGKKKRKAS